MNKIDEFPMIWGYALCIGGAKALRNGITVSSAIEFVECLILGFLVYSVFRSVSLVKFDGAETGAKRILYMAIELGVITYLATGNWAK